MILWRKLLGLTDMLPSITLVYCFPLYLLLFSNTSLYFITIFPSNAWWWSQFTSNITLTCFSPESDDLVIILLLVMAHESENWIINWILCCSVTSNSILDRAIDSEESHHNDFLRLVRPITFVLRQNPLLLVKRKVQITFNATVSCIAGPYWRISWTICKNKDIFFYRGCQMGCRVLCEGGWWCSCQSR